MIYRYFNAVVVNLILELLFLLNMRDQHFTLNKNLSTYLSAHHVEVNKGQCLAITDIYTSMYSNA